MIINNVEFAFSVSNISDLEKYEKAYTKLRPAIEEGDTALKDNKLGTAAKTYIKAIKAFFLASTGVDVVGNCEDFVLCIAFMEDFINQIAQQKQKIHDSYFSRKKGH